jgi:hypothetical protein
LKQVHQRFSACRHPVFSIAVKLPWPVYLASNVFVSELPLPVSLKLKELAG